MLILLGAAGVVIGITTHEYKKDCVVIFITHQAERNTVMRFSVAGSGSRIVQACPSTGVSCMWEMSGKNKTRNTYLITKGNEQIW